MLLLPQLRVRLSLQTLRHGAPVIEAVPADGLQFNLARIRLDDRPTGRLHQITDLSLGLPFLSNLPAHLPAQQRQGELRLACSQLDLAPWLGYLPTAPAGAGQGAASGRRFAHRRSGAAAGRRRGFDS